MRLPVCRSPDQTFRDRTLVLCPENMGPILSNRLVVSSNALPWHAFLKRLGQNDLYCRISSQNIASCTAIGEASSMPPSSIKGRVLPLALGEARLRIDHGDGFETLLAGIPGERIRASEINISPQKHQRLPNIPRLFGTTRILERSDHRCAPHCKVVNRCGGCTIQEMDYLAQVQAKARALEAYLQPLDIASACISPITPLKQPFGYRTKLLMPATFAGNRLRFGLYRPTTMDVLPAEKCPVQHPLVLSLLSNIQRALNQHRVRPSHTRSKNGWLHGVGIRICPLHMRGEVTLLGRDQLSPDDAPLLDNISQLANVHALFLRAHQTRSGYLNDGELIHLRGALTTPFQIANQTFLLSPGTFLQTSAEGADSVAEKVLELAPGHIERLADLYGGAAIFSRVLEKRWMKALVIESNPSAIEDARTHYTKATQQPNIMLVESPVETALKKLATFHPDVVLLDPPRRGCHPSVISTLSQLDPLPTVLYIACGPKAFLADATRLCQAGYHVDHVTGIDMFPHTPHLEIIARFKARSLD